MKNILILDTGKEWGGGTNCLLRLLERIDRNKYNFNVLFYYNYNKGENSNIQREIEKFGINFILLPQKSQSLLIKIIKEFIRVLFFYSKKIRRIAIFWIDYFHRIKPNARKIAEIITDLKIDLIYLNNQPSSNLEGILASKITGVPAIQHCRIEPTLNFFESRIVNYFLKKIICVSEGVKVKLLEQGINPEKCVIVYDGIDTTTVPLVSSDEIKQKLKLEEDIIIGTVSSLIKRKRIDVLIEVFSILVDKVSDKIKLIIVGEGPERKNLIELVKKKNLSDKIIFTGFQDDAISYINAFDIFVLTSEKEGLPGVILEAMLMSKPVVASNVTGPSELVIDGETGFLIPYRNVRGFVEKVIFLIKNPDLRIQMGKKGRERVIKYFSIEQYIKGVERAFEEVLEG
ncbi:MAG: glycosyltransferase family 4 protein [Thermodesulfovibrio sp.]|nr:glycosyltransferase family 4 protein [Thermodesulfovibrio sp.]